MLHRKCLALVLFFLDRRSNPFECDNTGEQEVGTTCTRRTRTVVLVCRCSACSTFWLVDYPSTVLVPRTFFRTVYLKRACECVCLSGGSNSETKQILIPHATRVINNGQGPGRLTSSRFQSTLKRPSARAI